MKQLIAAILAIVLVVILIGFSFTFNQSVNEERRLEEDIENRSFLITESLKDSVETNFINRSDIYLQSVVERFVDSQRIAGLSIMDNRGSVVASSSALPEKLQKSQKIAIDAMDADLASGNFINHDGNRYYVYAAPLHSSDGVVGSLVVIQNANYITNRLNEIWTVNLLRLIIQSVLIVIAIILFVRWVIITPLKKLLTSIQSSESDNPQGSIGRFSSTLFNPLAKEVNTMRQNLLQARFAASEEARLRIEKLDSPWTEERLKEFVKDLVKNREIVVVSNREPYSHEKVGGKTVVKQPASGMVTALEPFMQACGGTWIAHGSGTEDKATVDFHHKVSVPVDSPKYTLKRVWLTDKEIKGYYQGFSNEGIWPLCHNAHTRPIFRKNDWEEYVRVNEKFAESVLHEIKHKKNPIVFVQDFHFALLPKLIRKARKDAIICIFWHIPWPNAESFSICPWRKELLEGLLGADIVGFQTQQHCNNFIDTVGREIEALVDVDKFAVTKEKHVTYIKHFPISIAFTGAPTPSNELTSFELNNIEFKEKLGVKTKFMGVGVDRLDYTKGILERLKGIEILLSQHPSYIGNFTFVQLAAPSRTSVKEYEEFGIHVKSEIDRINDVFKKNGWKPILYINEHREHEFINSLYKASDFCLVTSLHDGMNLVAKEFIASRIDNKGVLLLSQFTGAASELRGAIILNPYNGEETAESIHTALTMPIADQEKRMKRLRDTVKNYNVYRWSAEIIKSVIDLG